MCFTRGRCPCAWVANSLEESIPESLESKESTPESTPGGTSGAIYLYEQLSEPFSCLLSTNILRKERDV
jgi:hypothetical protein